MRLGRLADRINQREPGAAVVSHTHGAIILRGTLVPEGVALVEAERLEAGRARMEHGGARDGAGRPPKGADARSVLVKVFLTAAEAARVDEQRGDLTRSEWLAQPLRSSV